MRLDVRGLFLGFLAVVLETHVKAESGRLSVELNLVFEHMMAGSLKLTAVCSVLFIQTCWIEYWTDRSKMTDHF